MKYALRWSTAYNGYEEDRYVKEFGPVENWIKFDHRYTANLDEAATFDSITLLLKALQEWVRRGDDWNSGLDIVRVEEVTVVSRKAVPL